MVFYLYTFRALKKVGILKIKSVIKSAIGRAGKITQVAFINLPHPNEKHFEKHSKSCLLDWIPQSFF